MVQKSLIKEKGILRLNGINANQILELLQNKHIKDVVIPECKNGETWGARDLLKLDAWVLRRSYSPLTTIGYEIKTSRADFEKDQKWTGYLDLCHEFYFVCPAGLIRATDLPSRVGILWASKGNRLYTKRKSERVEPDVKKLNRLLIYVVMARSKIVANMYMLDVEEKSRTQQIREAVEKANEQKELAYFIRGHIRKLYEELTKKEADLSYRERNVEDFERQLARLGITWDSERADWQDNQRVQQEIAGLKKVLDHWTLQKMRNTANQMIEFVNTVERLAEK